jgi:predicted secreted protein
MSLSTGIAIYFIIWWTVLFAVLPWGVRSQLESGSIAPGTDPGAPAIPRLLRKLGWTTIASTVVFALCALAYRYQLVTVTGLAALMGFTP